MVAKKATTKKDLESKIAELEAKLAKLSSQVQTQTNTQPKPAETKPAQTQAPPPKPQPAASSPRGSLPKGMGQKPAEAPKPAEKASSSNVAAVLETVYQNYPMTNTHDYKTKVPGYAPAPNRYFGRLHAPRGTVQTQSWNMQKSKVPGYTQPSNQYFATRARLAYHPPTKKFEGFGMRVDGVAAEAKVQAAPPKKSAARGSLPKGF
ncbi:trans-sialidase [Nitrosopumilus sp. b1]|uniref:trans-sialidase n=1 Tax=Nitrosopumilus sp. b1 TaxID=2109907 RepID=UPI0015F58FE5|nr:trans-sialidase [Nitrosopumilus sp. b1]KAF6242591.1 trans-sialidase [Nitrosopumilus sp. b1]